MDGDTTERLSQESQCPNAKSMAYWQEHPLSLEECLAQFKRLREQRNVCQAFLVFPQCPGSCQLSKHSERLRLFSYLPGSFLQELTPKDSWVLKNRYLHIRPTDDWKEQPNLNSQTGSGQKNNFINKEGEENVPSLSQVRPK